MWKIVATQLGQGIRLMWAKYIFVPLPDAGIRVYKRGPARD